MRVTAISPQAGEVSGGYEIRISGRGFWSSDDLTVRFVPLTEGRLPRGNLAVFDEHTGDVVCRVPKFSLSGEFAVEVAVDGKHFTSDGHRFEAFKNPVVENISLDDAQFDGGDELTIAVAGDIPVCCTQPMLRLIQDAAQESVTRVEKTTSFLVTGSGERGVADNELSTISFVMPAIEPCDDIMRFTMEISYNNGLQFVPIISPGESDSSEDYKPHVISFHNARVIRCRPNSFLSRALPQVFTITIHHLLGDHLDRVSVGLEVTELNISDPEAEARVDVSLPIVKLGGDSITSEETINLEDREEVTIFVALDGVHFQMDSSLRFIYCIAPEIHEISPVEAEPGTKMLIRADRFASSGAAWVRLTASSLGISHIVPVEVVENQQTAEFVLPPLPIPSEDTVFVAFSIDGQQFGIRPGATDGDSTSRESALSFRYRTS
ncbi:hypothetical protein Poli38472_011342 [Pythium oligandrum]|uniref:IPT/TIG domain-containing protein n=1 Tax=Pythium oligandrum TaxID=41045 RepID=A0A8K1CJ86_PYTOL|nr:hypothetical protein Poli38472_011342 [Pythium oligandrum]|eukprot:TMW64462.1 hypothetical protein Poli38472_011342 [Pythium oligandrum]